MLQPETVARIDGYWSDALGVDINALDGMPRVVAHHGRLAAYHGVYAVSIRGRLVVSAPDALVAGLDSRLAATTADAAFDPAALTRAIGDGVEGIVGPASIAYADAGCFTPAASNARLATPADDGALRSLAAAVSVEEWEHSGIEFEREPIFVQYDGDALVAACSWAPWGDDILHVGVVTHAAHRGRGHGRAVALAATGDGLQQGRIMQWQTLESNAPSLAIGGSLGYQPYVRTISIRLLP